MTAAAHVDIRPLPAVPGEREAVLPRQRRSVVEWADQERYLDEATSSIPGRWDWDITPWMREIAETVTDPEVRKTVIMGPVQMGKSELTNNVLGRTVDEAPAPTMIVMPTEDVAKRRIRTRVRPMFAACPSLRRHLPGGELEGLNAGQETVLDNMILYLAWANSGVALSDVPACNVILDEVDAYPLTVGDEGDPVSLAENRQRTFPFAFTLEVSTPRGGGRRIVTDYNEGDRCEWWVPCPHCGGWHKPEWRHVGLDKDEQGSFLPASRYESGEHARYVCPQCGACWDEPDRWTAVRAGQWVPFGCSVGDDGTLRGRRQRGRRIRSFHVWCFLLHPAFFDLGEKARKWVFATRQEKAGNPGPMTDFVNNELGRPRRESDATTSVEDLRDRKQSGYRMGTVAEGVRLITCGVDVQQDHFLMAVWGWGASMECWLIDAVRIGTSVAGDGPNAAMTFDPLAAALVQAYPRDDGGEAGIDFGLVDYQFRSDQVADFCVAFAPFPLWPARGDDNLRDKPTRTSDLEGGRDPQRARKLKSAGLPLLRVSMLLVKNRLARIQQTATPGPGYMHLPEDVPPAFVDQMASEELKLIPRRVQGRIKTERRWEMKPDATANHYWDCSVYALAAALQRNAHRFGDEPPRRRRGESLAAKQRRKRMERVGR